MASYSPDQLKAVTELSALFFTPAEIAVMQEWPADEFCADCKEKGSAAFNAFYAGRLQSELELRRSIIKLAKSGSSPAQTMAMDMLNKSKLKLL